MIAVILLIVLLAANICAFWIHVNVQFNEQTALLREILAELRKGK